MVAYDDREEVGCCRWKLNMEILLPRIKAKFESFVAAKYKDLLDKGLDVRWVI